MFVVGARGAVLQFNGGEWSTPTTPAPNLDRESVHGSARDKVFTVRAVGAIGRYVGID